MSKLEELLNKIREKGWKPRGLDGRVYILDNEGNRSVMIGKITDKFDTYNGFFTFNDLCSLDSGLWQFVVEKELYFYEDKRRIEIESEQLEWYGYNQEHEYYRVMLSSTEENKEQFLLDNIRIDE